MEPLLDARGLTEAQAIERYRSRNYPKPALTADIVVLSRTADSCRVLLIRRKGHPYLGCLALPGGFANENEPVELTAARELAEETGVTGLPLKLVGIFSTPGRDPRGWVVSAAFCADIQGRELSVTAGDDAAEAEWYRILEEEDTLLLWKDGVCTDARQLAFDHHEIIRKALDAVK